MALGDGGDLVAEEVEGDDARGWIRHHPEQRRVAAVEADLADVAHMRLGSKPPVHPPLLWYLARVTFELARVRLSDIERVSWQPWHERGHACATQTLLHSLPLKPIREARWSR